MQYILTIAALAFLWQYGYFWLLFALPVGGVALWLIFVIIAGDEPKAKPVEVKNEQST